MARALRIEIEGGRYHVTARGNERRPIFRQGRDRRHFLEHPWEGLVGGVVLGSEEHAPQLLKRAKRHPREEPARTGENWLGRWEGCDYTTVSKAVGRFGERLAEEPELQKQLVRIENEMAKL